MCIRYGGEEFLLVIEENEYTTVYRKIKKIQDSFGSKHFIWLDRHISFSFTVGISAKNKEEEDISTSIERADKDLYYGKNYGKNCIIFSAQREAL